MSEEQDKKATSKVSDAATVQQDIPVEPTALADDELDMVAGGGVIVQAVIITPPVQPSVVNIIGAWIGGGMRK